MSRYVMPYGGKGLKYRKEIPNECVVEIWNCCDLADSKTHDNPFRMLKEKFVGHNWVSCCVDVPLMHYVGKTFYVRFRRDYYIIQSDTRYSVTPAVKKIVEKYLNET